MEILSLKQKSKTNPNVMIVSTDNGEYELHLDVVVKNNIKKGLINDNIFFDCVNQSNDIIAFNLAAKFLASRQKTEQQVRDYIYKKGYHKNVVELVIEKLKHYNLVDDKLYAQSYIKSNPNFSRQKIKAKLNIAGVKAENYLDALETVDENESCLKSANKFLKNKTVDKAIIDKLVRRLAGQGYSWETINSTLKKLKAGIQE